MPERPFPPVQPEKWLVNRLKRISDTGPRYEATWYGAHNALLSHFFPYQQRFLIKPQPKIRDGMAEKISFSSTQAEASSSADSESITIPTASVTSTGGLIPSSGPTSIPDFLVVKATEFATHDRPLLVVEVKADEPQKPREWELAAGQLHEYMEKIAAQAQASPKFRLVGLLICGTRVQISRLNGVGNSIKKDRARQDITSTALWRLLFNIAKENWEDC